MSIHPNGSSPRRHPHRHPRIHYAGQRIVDMLEVLVRTGCAQSVADLIAFAQRGGCGEVVPILEEFRDEGVRLELVVNQVEARLAIEAYRTGVAQLQRLSGATVGLLLPLPPHIVVRLSEVLNTVLLLTEEHRLHLPPPLVRLGSPRVEGVRACRAAMATLGAVVFDAFRGREGNQVEASVLDVLDVHPGFGAPELLYHHRAHPHHEDLPLTHAATELCIGGEP